MKAENIAFWILILLIVGVAIWKMVGSPTDTAALISLTLFIAGSELLLWRALFSMDKKVSCGFMKIKYEMNDIKKEMKTNFSNINDSLNIITNKLIKVKSK